MNEDELLALLSDPNIPGDQKKRALAAKDRHKTDWPGTIAALGMDAGAGALGITALDKWDPQNIPKGWKRNTAGGVIGGGAGLAAAYGINALRNYYSNPLGQD
jgi:hypothetical protein